MSNLNLSGLPDSLAQFSVSRFSMAKILMVVQRESKLEDGFKKIEKGSNIDCINFEGVEFSYGKESNLFTNLSLRI